MSTGSTFSSFSCCLTIILVVIYITLANSSNACNTDNDCDNSTYICRSGQCVPSCDISCNNTDNSTKICGSDSMTYASQCELIKHNCLMGANITIKYFGQCHSCIKQKQTYNKLQAITPEIEWRSQTFSLWNRCKSDPESLVRISEIGIPFEPTCSESNPNDYALEQENKVCNTYWCSTPEGVMIEGSNTMKKAPDCSKFVAGVTLCEYNGKKYEEEDEIDGHPNGPCVCSDGEIFCPRNYSLHSSGKWPGSEMTRLMLDIMQMFYVQYDYSQLTERPDKHLGSIQLTYIAKNEEAIPEESVEPILNWKFKYYNRNGNEALEASDLVHFLREITDLTNVVTFQEQLTKQLDTNKDSKVSTDEWKNFFTQKDGVRTRRSILKRLRTRKNLQ